MDTQNSTTTMRQPHEERKMNFHYLDSSKLISISIAIMRTNPMLALIDERKLAIA